MISLRAAIETCEYELICINEEKSTATIERLKTSNVEKFTLHWVVKKFHIFTVLSAKYLISRVSHRFKD